MAYLSESGNNFLFDFCESPALSLHCRESHKTWLSPVKFVNVSHRSVIAFFRKRRAQKNETNAKKKFASG